LLRVEDVIGQLAAQIDGLKKQARQAIRYRTVSAQVRRTEATLFHLRWTGASAEVTEAERAKDLGVREVADRTGEEAEASKRQALAAASLPELREAEARAGAALHRLNIAQQDLDRITPLVKDDAAAKQELDAAVAGVGANNATVNAVQANLDQTRLSTRTQIASSEGKVEALRGAVKAAELNLEYATIRAPISGLIGDTLVPVGGLVTASSTQPLTTIVPMDPIWVRFKVSEAEYLSLRKRGILTQSPLTLALADNSEFPQKGRVENTVNQVDPKTGTLELQARFPNPGHTLLPGQFGKVRLQTESRKGVILVPQRAVQQLQSMQGVFTVEPNNKVESRPIVTAERVGDAWIVTQGLKPGDRIIVEGLLRVRPGMVVNPQPYKPASSSQARSGN